MHKKNRHLISSKIKICLVGPGIMSIPPSGWGAVEILIWDYYLSLKNKNINVTIINKMRNNDIEQSNINSDYCQDLIREINEGNFDFVHIHYDVLFHISDFLNSKVGLTSHYPYINNKSKHTVDGFTPIFNYMIKTKHLNLILSLKDKDFLKKHGASNCFLLQNGISNNLFMFHQLPINDKKTIYLGKISERKNQHKYCHLNNIDIIGPGGEGLKNWKGSWSRDEVHNKLSSYGNMLLISNGEADPLVIKEALVCGLGVVVNESSAKNLENKPFITIIPEDKLDDLSFIQNQIDNNRKISLKFRNEIKRYGEEKYGFVNLINNYLKIIKKKLNRVTIVTAFFDINREKKGDGRSLNEYLRWIKKTLQLNCNMFIITEKKFIDFMKENRPKNYKTYIKEDTLENAQYYKYYERINEILKSNEYKKKIAYPNRVECKLPEYNIIQYSKFGWLKEAIKENPFNSKYFFWSDAGVSRFFLDIDISKCYPNSKKVKRFDNRFIIGCRNDVNSYPFDVDNFIWGADNLLIGGMFGGCKNIIFTIDKKLEETFNNSMLKKNNVNNEQLGLLLVYKKNPELFNLINGVQNTHLWLFKYLSQ